MGVGAFIKILGDAGVFKASNTFLLSVGKLKESVIRFGLDSDARSISAGGATTFQAPEEPGLYRITHKETLQEECIETNHDANPARTVATVLVRDAS